jgi:hypothetical protein
MQTRTLRKHSTHTHTRTHEPPVYLHAYISSKTGKPRANNDVNTRMQRYMNLHLDTFVIHVSVLGQLSEQSAVIFGFTTFCKKSSGAEISSRSCVSNALQWGSGGKLCAVHGWRYMAGCPLGGAMQTHVRTATGTQAKKSRTCRERYAHARAPR